MPDGRGSLFCATIETDAVALIDRIEELGGAVAAIDAGFQQREIEEAAYRYARQVDDRDVTVVGVNRFEVDADSEPDVTVVDPSLEAEQVERLAARRSARDDVRLEALLSDVTAAATSTDNLLYPMKAALEAGATVGDITTALLPEFGRYRPTF